MKNVILISALMATFFSMSANAIIAPIGRSTNLNYDGTITAGSLEQRYIKVINKSGASVAAGKMMSLDLTSDDGAGASVIAAGANAAPLCLNINACAASALCLCQTYGYSAIALFDPTAGPGVAGRSFYMASANAGYIEAIAPAATSVPAGIFYDAATATGAVEVFLKLD